MLPPVDTEAIREVKNAVSIPVIGNGDITDGQSAALMFEKTNCDFLMVGRGALGRPWVFAQINAYMTDGRILPGAARFRTYARYGKPCKKNMRI